MRDLSIADRTCVTTKKRPTSLHAAFTQDLLSVMNLPVEHMLAVKGGLIRRFETGESGELPILDHVYLDSSYLLVCICISMFRSQTLVHNIISMLATVLSNDVAKPLGVNHWYGVYHVYHLIVSNHLKNVFQVSKVKRIYPPAISYSYVINQHFDR